MIDLLIKILLMLGLSFGKTDDAKNALDKATIDNTNTNEELVKEIDGKDFSSVISIPDVDPL